MSAAAGQSADKGKDPETVTNGNTGFRPQANMTMQRPRPEDLQKSYASVIVDDPNPKGWYGTMGMSLEHSPKVIQKLTDTL